MGAGVGVGDGDVADAVNGEGVVKGAVLAQDAAVPVGGVFAEADIGHDEEGRKACAEKADGEDDGALGVIGCYSESVFDAWGDRDAEQDDGAKAFADERAEVGKKFVDASAVLVGEGGD